MPIPLPSAVATQPACHCEFRISRAVGTLVSALILAAFFATLPLRANEPPESKSSPSATTEVAAKADTEDSIEVPIEDPAVDELLEKLASAPYAPVMTETGHRAYLFSIPAPRGLILDRHGNPLARNRSARCLALRLSQIDAIDEDSAVELVDAALDANPAIADLLIRPTPERVRLHWTHRRGLPLTVSAPLSEDEETEMEHSMGPAFSLETIYLRDYPQESTACHIVGHVSREAPQLDGPVVRGESLWPTVRGRSGMEEMYDELLAGSPGLLSELYDADGTLLSRKMLRAPRPGLTFVTSIDLKMQKLAESILTRKDRPGAMVSIDADNGEILAMASFPRFNPADFVPSISEEKYEAIKSLEGNPFFPRATQAVYPPGSTFKPFVAIAALDHDVISGRTYIAGPPSLNIAGRTFHNWSTKHQGNLNVEQALARSSNTWFYRVGIETGGQALRESIQKFGFGRSPDIPIDGTSAGVLPPPPQGQQATANYSIGQGDILVSPLQMALATAGIANGERVPWAKLVLQTQTPPPNEKVLGRRADNGGEALNFRPGDIELVRAGMWSAVNGSGGTGKSANIGWPEVSGKTGTAQWNAGTKKRNVAWFTGYVNADKPRIAIAVAIEGKTNVTTAGGAHAAPLAQQFLSTVYKNPTTYAVQVPRRGAHTRIASSSSSSRSGSSNAEARALRSTMVQISPDRDKLAESLSNPSPTSRNRSSSPASATRVPANSSSSSTTPRAKPVAPTRERGGFLSRLRSLFPSSN